MNAPTLFAAAGLAAPATFDDATPPSSTPWGAPQGGWTREAPGIYSCSTAGHGGLWLSPQRYAAMPAELKRDKFCDGPWLEEDSDWLLAVRAWPDEFSEEMREHAERDRQWRIRRAAEDKARADAKAAGEGWVRAAINLSVGQFKPEFREAAQQVEAAAGKRLVFVLDDNDRRAIVVDYAPGRPIAASTETRLSSDMLERAPF